MSFELGKLEHLYPFTPKRLTLASGQRLSYVDEGPAEGHALLMVHGNPTWSFYYRDVIKAFSGSMRCVAPDHIGAGLSDKPQDYPYTLATHAQNLGELTAHLGLDDVTLMVHDWGGAIGMVWALMHLPAVKRLVVLNTAAFRSRRIPFSINICRIPGFGALMIRGLNAFGRAAVVRAPLTRLAPDVKRGYLGPYDSWANRVGHLRFVQDIPMHPGVPSWSVMEELEAGLPQLTDRPMLICWGGGDFCFNDSFLAGWQERFPAAEVHRFAHAGHYVLEDAGEEVVALMRAFFAQHPLASASASARRAES